MARRVVGLLLRDLRAVRGRGLLHERAPSLTAAIPMRILSATTMHGGVDLAPESSNFAEISARPQLLLLDLILQ